MPDPGIISEAPGGVSYTFPEFKLDASLCLGRHYFPVVLFVGVLSTERHIAELEFEMPREVESFEQGVAWVTALLDMQAKHFDPGEASWWLECGRSNAATLPWERKRAAFAARPSCSVRRDWMRMALRDLRALASQLEPDEPVRFTFDGEALKVRCGSEIVVVPARGSAWDQTYSISSRNLTALPGRLMNPTVVVDVWEDRLRIANRTYALIPEPRE